MKKRMPNDAPPYQNTNEPMTASVIAKHMAKAARSVLLRTNQ